MVGNYSVTDGPTYTVKMVEAKQASVIPSTDNAYTVVTVPPYALSRLAMATTIIIPEFDTSVEVKTTAPQFKDIKYAINVNQGIYGYVNYEGFIISGTPTVGNPIRQLPITLQCILKGDTLNITVSPSTLDFETVSSGAMIERTLTLTAAGAAQMPPITYTITPSGDLSGDIVVLDPQGVQITPNAPITLATAENDLTVVVTGRSIASGPVSGNINITATVL